MREEIRLGNEALATGDVAIAVKHYQALLDKGGTEIEERIARNRLSQIAYREKKRQQEQEKEEKKKRSPSRAKGSKKTKLKIEEENQENEVRESTKLIYSSKTPLVDIKKQ